MSEHDTNPDNAEALQEAPTSGSATCYAELGRRLKIAGYDDVCTQLLILVAQNGRPVRRANLACFSYVCGHRPMATLLGCVPSSVEKAARKAARCNLLQRVAFAPYGKTEWIVPVDVMRQLEALMADEEA